MSGNKIWIMAPDLQTFSLEIQSPMAITVEFSYRSTLDSVTRFQLFFQFLCIYYQPNLWLSDLRLLASHQEVYGLSTGLKFDFFSFKFFKIVQIFSHFVNQCESGVHSYQFYYVPSTSSPILKSLVPMDHLVTFNFEVSLVAK